MRAAHPVGVDVLIPAGINVWQPLAGLALFLLAIAFLEEAIRAIAGGRFKTLLVQHTKTPLRGVLSGTVATAVLQSSSLVSLMMLAFVGARVLPMKNALAVVFGANLGTTATGWLVATIGFKLDLEGLALPLIGVGGLVMTLSGGRPWRHYGRLVLALGLLLLGLRYMKGAVGDAAQLIGAEELAAFGAIEFLLFGVAFSAIVQSSSATIAVALSALNAGVIDLGAAAALAIGADLGTTSTVLLGAIRGSAAKKRVALGHFLFNLVTDLIAFAVRMPLLVVLAPIGDPVLILVAFHSAFNILGLVVFLPVIGRFANFLERRFVVAEAPASHLADVPTAVPDAAVQAIENEVVRLLARVAIQNQLAVGTPLPQISSELVLGPLDLQDHFEPTYEQTKALEGEILAYALDLDRRELPDEQKRRLDALLEISRNAILSSKLCRDSRPDFEHVQEVDPALFNEIRSRQQDLDAHISRIACQPGEWTLKQLHQLDRDATNLHAQLHQRIYQDIKADVIDEPHVSMVLNLNRALYNSNRVIISALASLLQALKRSSAMPASEGPSAR